MPVPAGPDTGDSTIGDPYATADELKDRLEVTDTTYDDQIDEVLGTASREIDTWTGRQFGDAGTTSARVYEPTSCGRLLVDDFHTSTGLAVATGTDGTYTTSWSATDWQLYPLNGIVDGMPGWPYRELVAVGGRTFPVGYGRPTVQVTARWGWAEVPYAVKQATLILAAELLKLKDAPFGVAGFGDFGAVRIRDNPRARSLLAPYRRNPVLVG